MTNPIEHPDAVERVAPMVQRALDALSSVPPRRAFYRVSQGAAFVMRALSTLYLTAVARAEAAESQLDKLETENASGAAMKAALAKYNVDTPEQFDEMMTKYADRRMAAEASKASLVGALREANDLILSETARDAATIYGPLTHGFLVELLAQRDAILRQALATLESGVAAADANPERGARLRPRAELLAMIDGMVAEGMQAANSDTLPMLSALSEAAERIRAEDNNRKGAET